MRKEFLTKVSVLRRKKEEKKSSKSIVNTNINLVRNWIKLQHAQKNATSFVNEKR